MISGILIVEDTSGPTILVCGVEYFSIVEEFGIIIVETLAVEKLEDQHSQLMNNKLLNN